MYKDKVHYVCCESCGWRLQMTQDTLHYEAGDYCKNCGKQFEEYELLYRQSATYHRKYYQ